MFHIVFAANEEYIKYCAVLINSIVKNTDTSKSFKDFFATNLACMQNVSLESSAIHTGGGG